MTKFLEKPKEHLLLAILGPYCPIWGKYEFSRKTGLLQFFFFDFINIDHHAIM